MRSRAILIVLAVIVFGLPILAVLPVGLVVVGGVGLLFYGGSAILDLLDGHDSKKAQAPSSTTDQNPPPVAPLGRAEAGVDVSQLRTRLETGNWVGRCGDVKGAVARLSALEADCDRLLGPQNPDTLAVRYALARWQKEVEAADADGEPSHDSNRQGIAKGVGHVGDGTEVRESQDDLATRVTGEDGTAPASDDPDAAREPATQMRQAQQSKEAREREATLAERRTRGIEACGACGIDPYADPSLAELAAWTDPQRRAFFNANKVIRGTQIAPGQHESRWRKRPRQRNHVEPSGAPLRRRDVIRFIEHKGWQQQPNKSGSHKHWKRPGDGRTLEIDEHDPMLEATVGFVSRRLNYKSPSAFRQAVRQFLAD